MLYGDFLAMHFLARGPAALAAMSRQKKHNKVGFSWKPQMAARPKGGR